MKKLKLILMAILFAFGQTLALPALAQTSDKVTNVLISGAIGCVVGAITTKPTATYTKGTGCIIAGGVGMIISAILPDDIFGVNAAPDSRWSFDGSDGMPKAVYSFSDSAKFSLGTQGEPLNYDGIAIGVKYSF